MKDKIDILYKYFELQCLAHENEEVDIDVFIDIADTALLYAKKILEDKDTGG